MDTNTHTTNEKNRKRGLGGVGVDDAKGLAGTAGGTTDRPDHSISVAPVAGSNAQRGADLGIPDEENVSAPVSGGHEFEFGSESGVEDTWDDPIETTEDGARSEIGGPAGMEARVLSNTGAQHLESSKLAAETIPAGATFAHDGMTGRRDGTRFEEDEGTGAGIGDRILAKIRDLGDAIEKAGDRLRDEDHSKIRDAFGKLSGRFAKPGATNDRALGGRMGPRDLQ